MRKSLLLVPALLLFISSCFTLNAQVQEWQNIRNFPDARSGAVSFVIGNTAYVGTGYDGKEYKKTFYKYSSATDTWRTINDFPGAARRNAVAFVADGKAYVGTGSDESTQFKDFYEFDPSTGNWNPIADLTGEIRSQASSFSINNKGYVGLGGNNTGSLSDFYEFDPATGNWSSVVGLETSDARSNAVGFSSNGKGYITSGRDGSFVFSGLLSYDPSTNSWMEEIFSDVKLSSLQQNTVYTDSDGLVHIQKSGFTMERTIIDPSDNSLRVEDSYFEDERNGGVAFYLDGNAYAGIGSIYDSFGYATYQNDFRKQVTIFPPEAPTNLRKSGDAGLNLNWDNKDYNQDGFIVYVSENDNNSFEVVDTVTYSSYQFDTLKQGVRHYIKVAAYNKGGTVESDEIDYIPLYNSGKLVAPTLKEVNENQNDSTEIEMFLQFINYDQAGRVNFEMSTDGINFTSQFTQSVQKLDTATASYEPFFEEESEKLYYRIKLIADGREDSDYSNVVVFDTKELQPLAPQIKCSVKQTYAGYGNFDFEYFISFSKYNHVDSIALKAIQKDTIKFEKIIKYSFGENAARFVLQPNDTISLLAINSNVFGSDTFNVKIVAPAFNKPSFEEYVESNTNAIQLSLQSNVDFFKGYTIIERAYVNSGFMLIDSIKPGDFSNSGRNAVYFIDNTVEANKEYKYRLRNSNENQKSLYSGVKSIKSSKTPAWKVFRQNSLRQVLDSMENANISNIFHGGNKIFFLSVYNKKGYYFDLDLDKLVKMENIPLTEEYDYNDSEFTQLNYMNGKLYCFTPIIEYETSTNTDIIDKTIISYNVVDDSWSSKQFPEISEVKYAVPLSDNEILLTLKEGSKLAIFNTESKDLNISDLSVDPTYIEVLEDSVMAFNGKRNIYQFDKGLTARKYIGQSNGILKDRIITEYQGKLLQVGEGKISEIDTKNDSILSYIENFPFFEQRYSFVFSYKDTLVHFDGLYSNSIRDFYYRNTEAPGKIVGLNMEEITYTSAKASWVDSPDETAYSVSLILRENAFETEGVVIATDTIAQNSTSYAFSELYPGTPYLFTITPLNESNIGAEDKVFFSTKNARPLIPEDIELKQVTKDSLQLSWKINPSSPKVDSIIVGNITKTVKSTGDFQSIYLEVRNENDSIRAFIRAKNQWDISWDGVSNKILTRLNTATITEVAYFEKEGKYQLIINDSSLEETQFKIYRKTIEEEQFELLETIEGNQPNEFTFDDFIDDSSITFEYYVQSYLVEDDFNIKSSFPSNVATTENSVLSNTPLQSNEISIFPNPVSEQIYISSELNIQLQQIEVLSTEGRLIKTFESSESIDISELEKGFYLLKIKAKSGEVIKRFIKE